MTDAARPRILGSLGSADGTGVVRIEDRYARKARAERKPAGAGIE